QRHDCGPGSHRGASGWQGSAGNVYFKSKTNLFAAGSWLTVAASSLEIGLLYFTGTRSSRFAAICSLDIATASATETARLGRAAVIDTLYGPTSAPGRPLVTNLN